jgi:hypothetical protein
MEDSKVVTQLVVGWFLVSFLWIGTIALFTSVWVGFWTGLLIGAFAYISGLLIGGAYSYVVYKKA